MSIGIWQLILILLIVFVIFGAGKLPKVMKELGNGIKSFRDGIKEGNKNKKGSHKKNLKSLK